MKHNFLLRMEIQEAYQTFINELLRKQNEMISKELNEYFISTLGDVNHKQHKCNYIDTYRKLSLYEYKIKIHD